MVKKFLQIGVLSLTVSVLAACSTTNTGAGSTDGSNGSGTTAGVQTAGAGGSDTLNGLSNPNAMVPGANQHYFFDFNQSTVHSSDLPSIKVQAQYLVSHPSARIEIQGNTDIRGSREYNIALGQRRAEAVKKVFMLDGASASQIHTVSFGAEKPAATGNTETDYAQNRRADVVFNAH